MSNTAAQVVALFGAGVASFLAPCIVPLVPAYLGIIVGEMGDAHDPAARRSRRRLLFIAGFTTVFAGSRRDRRPPRVVADDVPGHGAGRRRHRHHVMGLALLGILRGPLARERRLIPHVAEGHRGGAALRRRRSRSARDGARAWVRCSRRRSRSRRAPGKSGAALCSSASYAAGIGVPFLLAALGLASSPALAERLRRAGPTLERSRASCWWVSASCSSPARTCTSRRISHGSSPPCTGSEYAPGATAALLLHYRASGDSDRYVGAIASGHCDMCHSGHIAAHPKTSTAARS